jgi:hypothetical protein
MKKFIKLMGILCKCGVIALRVALLDNKYSRLIRKGRIIQALDAYEKMILLVNKGMSYCNDAFTMIET